MKFDTDLDADDLKEVIKRYKGIYRKALNEEFPQDPKDQLFEQSKRYSALGTTHVLSIIVE